MPIDRAEAVRRARGAISEWGGCSYSDLYDYIADAIEQTQRETAEEILAMVERHKRGWIKPSRRVVAAAHACNLLAHNITKAFNLDTKGGGDGVGLPT